ncbi:hypothetical protein COCNU_06G008330 [Cocos nucifera]|uniref:Uncharacterized protein n=1 Tax=Cocos nucifera TaxID=13894 RepID=A0A8K0N324_COCNU|nr:hypothetical protein COCNU_06G008330 [Cocos nucifera]
MKNGKKGGKLCWRLLCCICYAVIESEKGEHETPPCTPKKPPPAASKRSGGSDGNNSKTNPLSAGQPKESPATNDHIEAPPPMPPVCL